MYTKPIEWECDNRIEEIKITMKLWYSWDEYNTNSTRLYNQAEETVINGDKTIATQRIQRKMFSSVHELFRSIRHLIPLFLPIRVNRISISRLWLSSSRFFSLSHPTILTQSSTWYIPWRHTGQRARSLINQGSMHSVWKVWPQRRVFTVSPFSKS